MADPLSKPVGKPVDRWLTLAAAAVGIVFGLTDKTPATIVFWLLVIFALLVHPIWNFWWIDETKLRRISALAVFAIAVCAFGYSLWPKLLTLSNEQVCANTKAFSQRLRTFDHERHLGLREMEKQYMERISAAKSQEEGDQLGKERSDYESRWYREFQYDFETKYQSDAWSLRN